MFAGISNPNSAIVCRKTEMESVAIFSNTYSVEKVSVLVPLLEEPAPTPPRSALAPGGTAASLGGGGGGPFDVAPSHTDGERVEASAGSDGGGGGFGDAGDRLHRSGRTLAHGGGGAERLEAGKFVLTT